MPNLPLTIFAAGLTTVIILVAIAILRTEKRSAGWVFYIGFRTDTSKEHIDRDGTPEVETEREVTDPSD